MINKTFATYTLGCKVNQYETNAVEEILNNNGYRLVDFEEKADIYIINTCTVTSMSDKKSRQIIRRARKNNSQAIIVVMGCYAQNDPDKVIQIKDVNLVMGTKDKNKIFEEISKINVNDKIVRVSNIMDEVEFENLNVTNYSKNTRAFVKIQDGCDRYCTYCIIPYTRGRIRSRNLEDIIKEVKVLSDNGYKEIVLTGIHIASYGKDFKQRNNLNPLIIEKSEKDNNEDFNKNTQTIQIPQNITLIDVIEELSKIELIKRIRIGSVEPLIITDDFLKRLSKLDKFCPHFHLSLQSGCNQTLKRMNRRYTTEQYFESVQKIRKYFDNPAITTDIIAGFPGETDEEFEQTYNYLKKINLYEMHIFPFSKRSGTKAYDMKEQVPDNIKHLRTQKLIELAEKNKKEFEEKFIGKTLEILFEQKVDGYFEGHTKNFVKVYVKTNEEISGFLKNVRIKQLKDGKLLGDVI